MLLRQILKRIPHKEVIGDNLNQNIESASSDSRLVFNNSIFLLRKGEKYDGFDFIPQVKKKASCFIGSVTEAQRARDIYKKNPEKVFVLVEDINRTADILSKVLFKAIKNLKVIGVTGTNGKTTVAYLINKILNDRGFASALLSTVSYNWLHYKVPSFMTTLDNFMLKSVLGRMYRKGVKYVITEVSSHGLVQDRLKDICLLRAVFTNLSQEHLDFHKNMKNYFSAKRRIFRLVDNKKGKAVINIDDKYGDKLFNSLKIPGLSFSINKPADYKARAYRFEKNKLEFLMAVRKKDYLVKAYLLGEFNIYNILAAIACCDSLKIGMNNIVRSIASFRPPLGRLEEVTDSVYIDYAHTPQALKHAISALRFAKFSKIIVVFGCGGDRDKSKRPQMGRIVCNNADFGIITSDNPRSEDPLKICKQIEKGIKTRNYKVIVDRRKAIKEAVKMKKNKKDTAVLIAGKGHEDYQIFRDKTIHFSDKQVVRQFVGQKSDSPTA